MNRHARKLRELSTLVLKHGVGVERKPLRYYEPSLPKTPYTSQQKVDKAEALVSAFATAPLLLPEAIRAVRRGNTLYEARETVLSELRATSFEAERGEAMVGLLNRGLDAHPIFAELAAAQNTAEVRSIMSRASVRKAVLAA